VDPRFFARIVSVIFRERADRKGGLAPSRAGPALGDLEASGLAALTSIDISVFFGGVACVLGIGVIAAAIPEFTLFRAFAKTDVAADAGTVSLPSAIPSE